MILDTFTLLGIASAIVVTMAIAWASHQDSGQDKS